VFNNVYYLDNNEEDKQRVILRHIGKYQATKEDKYCGYFEKVNSLSSVNMVA
jgi:hypothetical protein